MKDDMLGLDRTEYTDMDIRLDGYWWNKLELSHDERITTYFFYQNGVILHGRSMQVSQVEEKEKDFSSESFRKLVSSNKSGWGVFRVNGSKIKFEMWTSSNGGPLKTVVRSGEILNDETFVITSFLNNYSGETSTRNDTFYFKKFSPKPDSTNTFIE